MILPVPQLDGEGLNEGLSEGLNEGLKAVLKIINNNPGIQAKRIAELLNNRPIKTVERQIKTLAEKELIERRGSKKTGGYFKTNEPDKP
jgi:ATP-dependent DNA helicase RecG